MLPKLLNADNSNSLNQNFRKKRFAILNRMIQSFERPINILDIGGTYNYWKNMGFEPNNDIQIVLLNLKKEKVEHPSFTSVVGDATKLEYQDQSFDIVFSNSVMQ